MKNLFARKPKWLPPILLAALLASIAAGGGCETRQIGPPPVTVEQYDRSLTDRAAEYPPRTVVLHNLRRVLDASLSEADRVASLKLIERLDRNDPTVRDQLMGILTDESNGEALRLAVLEMLLGKDDPALAVQAARILPGLKPDSPMREKILAFLGRNAAPGMLSETVRVWASQPSTTGLEEPRFRQAVERVTGKSWDQALLDAVNTPGFTASEEAISLLAGRVAQPRLRSQVVSMTARTQAMLALQVLIRLFDYFPTNKAAIRGAMEMGKVPPVRLEEASRLAAAWRRDFSYAFDVRDFPLINELARDSVRRQVRRTEMVLELAQRFIKRQHVARKASNPPGPYDYSDQLSRHVDALSMVDLWNLHILNEMLSRPRVQMALKAMADRDQADTTGAWGGLVFYESAKAEAKLYPADASAADDRIYRPSAAFRKDAGASLCRFFGHFEKVDNAGRAGPTAEEIRLAAEDNSYGLVLTRVTKDSFCAHYFTPRGLVISLGVMPLR